MNLIHTTSADYQMMTGSIKCTKRRPAAIGLRFTFTRSAISLLVKAEHIIYQTTGPKLLI